MRHHVARHLEDWVMAQGARLVAVLIAQGHLVDALAHLLPPGMHNARGVACVTTPMEN